MKFSTPEAMAQWEDFKDYLATIGVETGRNETMVKMAFLHGYAMGKQQQPQRPAPEMEYKATISAGFMGNVEAIGHVLKEAKRPMRPQEIMAAVRSRFGLYWNKNSVSGHIKLALKHDPDLRKLDYGLYAHKDYAGYAVQLQPHEMEYK